MMLDVVESCRDISDADLIELHAGLRDMTLDERVALLNEMHRRGIDDNSPAVQQAQWEHGSTEELRAALEKPSISPHQWLAVLAQICILLASGPFYVLAAGGAASLGLSHLSASGADALGRLAWKATILCLVVGLSFFRGRIIPTVAAIVVMYSAITAWVFTIR